MVCACLYAGPGPTRWWAAITVTEVLAFLDMTNGAPAREDGVGATITPIGRRVLWGPAARRGIPRSSPGPAGPPETDRGQTETS